MSVYDDAFAQQSKVDPAITACLEAAFKEYNTAKLVILQNAVAPSIEDLLGQRRLEERYCLKVVQCIGGQATTSVADQIRALQFSRCLKDEALEKYDAKER